MVALWGLYQPKSSPLMAYWWHTMDVPHWSTTIRIPVQPHIFTSPSMVHCICISVSREWHHQPHTRVLIHNQGLILDTFFPTPYFNHNSINSCLQISLESPLLSFPSLHHGLPFPSVFSLLDYYIGHSDGLCYSFSLASQFSTEAGVLLKHKSDHVLHSKASSSPIA